MRRTKTLMRIMCLMFAMMFCGVALADEVEMINSEGEVTENSVPDGGGRT